MLLQYTKLRHYQKNAQIPISKTPAKKKSFPQKSYVES